MENATKALVIAGAVLVTILLISVGIMVFNSAKDPLDDSAATMGSTAVQSFNSKFTGYFGDKVPGSNVKSLLGEIRSSNATNESHKIAVKCEGGIVATTADEHGVPSNNAIVSSGKYEVDATNYADGFITEITITKK